MALMSDYLENQMANHVFRGKPMESPKEVWVGLLFGDPTDSSKQTELSGRGYKREKVLFDSPKNGLVKNAEDIVFHKATAAWKTVTHLSIYDQEAGGKTLFHGLISSPIKIGKNKNFFIKVDNLQVGFE